MYQCLEYMFEDFSLCLIVHVRVCNTHSVRSFGMWLKLDSGMRVMLLLLRVLDTQKQRDRKSEMQFFFTKSQSWCNSLALKSSEYISLK